MVACNVRRVAVSRQDLLARAIQFLRLKEGGEIAQKSLLQGMTSAVRIDLSEQGPITSKRLDLLVSPGGRSKGMHPRVPNPSVRTFLCPCCIVLAQPCCWSPTCAWPGSWCR